MRDCPRANELYWPLLRSRVVRLGYARVCFFEELVVGFGGKYDKPAGSMDIGQLAIGAANAYVSK